MPFKKGQSGNPEGRPKKQVDYLGAILEATTEQDAVDVFKKLLEKAKGGDARSCQIVLEYLVGKPAQKMDLTTGGETFNQGAKIVFTDGSIRDRKGNPIDLSAPMEPGD